MRFVHQNLWQGCVGAWCPSQDNSRSTLLTDFSPYRNHGTLTNMDPATDWVASQGNIALDFDGTNDHILLAPAHPAPHFQLTHISVSAWVACRTHGTYPAPVAYSDGSSNGWRIWIDSGACKFGINIWNVSNASGAAIAADLSWHHVCGTYDGATCRVYVDGREGTSASDAGPINYTNASPPQIGGQSSWGFWNGHIDDVRLYNRALTASESATLALRRGIAYETSRTVSVRVAAAGGTTVTPTTLALVLTPYAPTVTTPQTLTPTTLALTLTAFAPTVSTPVLATPTTAALVLTAFEPTVATPVLCTPTTATLTLTAFEPTVTAGGSITVTPTTATLTLTAFAPTVSTPVLATPTTATLVLTAYAPTVSTPQTVTPTTLALTLSTFTPTVTGVAPITVTPTTATLVLTAYPPTVSTVTADQIWTINLSLTGRRTATDLAVTTTASCLVVTAARSTAFACQYNDAVPAIAAGYGFLVEADGDYLVNSDGDYLIASV